MLRFNMVREKFSLFMKRRIFIILLLFLSLLLLLVGGTVAGLYLAIKSGRLGAAIEQRAEQATGLRVRIGPLHLSWPLGISAESFAAALPGQEGQPIIASDKLKITTSPAALVRRQIVLVEVMSPKVLLTPEAVEFLQGKVPSEGAGSGGFSVGYVKILHGEATFLRPSLRARLDDFSFTFGKGILPARGKSVLTLNSSKAQLEIINDQNPVKLDFDKLKADVSLLPSNAVLKIDGKIQAEVSSDLPFAALPPQTPVGLSLKADYQPDRNSVQNIEAELETQVLQKVRLTGSVLDIGANAVPHLTFSAQVPHLQEAVEYIEALNRPDYKDLKVSGSLDAQGTVEGTFQDPVIAFRAIVHNTEVEWKRISVKGITAEIPGKIEAESYSFGPGKVNADSAEVPVRQNVLPVSVFTATVSGDSSGMLIENAGATLGALGKVAASGNYHFDTGRFSGNLAIRDGSSEPVVRLISEALGETSAKKVLSGKYFLDCAFEGRLDGGDVNQVNADFDYQLKNADFSPVASVRMSGLDAGLKGNVSTEAPAESWRFNITGNAGNFAYKSDSFEKSFSGKTFPVSFSGTYYMKSGALSDAQASLDFAPYGKFAVLGGLGLSSGKADLSFEAADVDMQQISELLSPSVFVLPPEMTVGGKANFRSTLVGDLFPTLRHLRGDFSLDVQNGEFSSGELMTVAGVAAKTNGSFKTDSPREAWTLNIRGEAGDFELLVDTFYNNFQNKTFPFSFAGEYLVDGRKLQNLVAALALADAGELTAEGNVNLSPELAVDLQVQTQKLDMSKLYEQVGRQALSTFSPVFKKAAVSGFVAGRAFVRTNDAQWQTSGNLKLDGGSIAMNGGSFSVGGLSANLPFGLHSPGKGDGNPPALSEQDFGTIAVKDIVMGPAQVAALDLNVALQDNSLVIKNPPPVDLLGGKLDVGEVRAQHVLDSSMKIEASLSAEGLTTAEISKEMGLPEISGTILADFPSIIVSREAVSTTGKAVIHVFDGSVVVTSVAVEEPFSPVRTLKADLKFDGIRLSELTETLNFGKITGVMNGTIDGLEMSQGQPAAFVADFQTVPTKNVAQRISFDAVQNISILGTGRGFQATLSRSLFSFIDEFRYDTIGFYTTLKNDNFKLGGKVVKDNTEYFVKGALLGPSINVINRNPGQTVSFKSMLERIGRIGRTQSSGAEEP